MYWESHPQATPHIPGRNRSLWSPLLLWVVPSWGATCYLQPAMYCRLLLRSATCNVGLLPGAKIRNLQCTAYCLQPAVRESHPCVWWTKHRFSMAAGNRRPSWTRQDAFICEYVVLTVHVRVECRLRFLGGRNCPVSRA